MEQPPEYRRRELAARISSLIGDGETLVTAIPGLTLHRRTAPTPPCHLTYEPGVILVAQGSKQVQLGPNTLIHDSSCYLLTSVDLPAVASVTSATPALPCLAVSLKLNISIVREFLGNPEFQVPAGPPAGLAISTGPVTARFIDAWRRLLDLLVTPEDIPWLSSAIQREIIYLLLRGPGGARLRAIATTGDHSQRTARVTSWIKANYSKPLRTEQLAEIAGMAVSTFHRHFRTLTGMSPLQYQKQIRLQAARARLLTGDVDAATVAFQVGYESASQFNREYSRLFGQPPVRDVRNLRPPAA